MSRCKCGVPERNENWQLDGCEELRDLKAQVQQLKDALTAAESRGREAGLREALSEIRAGRTVNNFGHIPAVVRALEWVYADVSSCLSRIPSPSTMEQEGCEWLKAGVGMAAAYKICDGRIIVHANGFNFCPFCGKTITVISQT